MTTPDIPREALVPKWRPSIPVDISAVVDRMRYYTDGKWRFVVFVTGTCVLVSNISEDPASEAKTAVRNAGFGHVDFKPRPMDHGNTLVGFTNQVAGVVLMKDFNEHRAYIEANFHGGISYTKC